jgi:hypothetical protein
MNPDPTPQSRPPAVLGAFIQLQSIRLQELEAFSKSISDEAQNFKLKIEQSSVVHDKGKDSFVVHASVKANLLGPTDKTMQAEADASSLEVHAYVKATYELKYKVPKEMTGDLESLDPDSFAKVNGTYNAWPYLRLIVQDTFAKMNFPMVLLPLFRAAETKPAAAQR